VFVSEFLMEYFGDLVMPMFIISRYQLKHAPIACCIVSYSLWQCLHRSVCCGLSFRIYFLQLLVLITWSPIAHMNPSVSGNISDRVSQACDAVLSTQSWFNSCTYLPCSAFCDNFCNSSAPGTILFVSGGISFTWRLSGVS